MVRVELAASMTNDQQPQSFTRMVMHRYPERSQDFVAGPEAESPPTDQPSPDDTTSNLPAPSMMNMQGQRRDPHPAIRLVYLDNSKPQFHLLAEPDSLDNPLLIARLPRRTPAVGRIGDTNRFPIGRMGGAEVWVHVTEALSKAMQTHQPEPTAQMRRDPSEVGQRIHALLPVDLSMKLPADEAASPDEPRDVWRRRVWLAHMQYPYPHLADPAHFPVLIDIPAFGSVQLAFSRSRMDLPFSIALEDFEMTPYPGSDIPLDYIARIRLQDLAQPGQLDQPSGQPITKTAKLNDPAYHQGFKISQAGWDPPRPDDPQSDARDDQGRFINQQRYSIFGIGNNRGVELIAFGSILIVLGTPWAFYIKPWLVRRRQQAPSSDDAGQGSAA